MWTQSVKGLRIVTIVAQYLEVSRVAQTLDDDIPHRGPPFFVSPDFEATSVFVAVIVDVIDGQKLIRTFAAALTSSAVMLNYLFT